MIDVTAIFIMCYEKSGFQFSLNVFLLLYSCSVVLLYADWCNVCLAPAVMPVHCLQRCGVASRS